MLKKMTVLAMAVGILAAVALPTSASANWKHHATNIQENKTLNFTGNAKFQGQIGGVECQLTLALVLEPGTTGIVEGFTTDKGTETEKCNTQALACQIHNLTPQMPSWIAHTVNIGGQDRIQVTNTDIVMQATGGFFCLIKKITLTAPSGSNNVTLTPNQPNTLTGGQFSGEIQADIETNNGSIHKEQMTVSGSIEPENTATESHTYSI